MLTHGILKHVDRVRLGAQLSRIFRALTCSANVRYLNDLVIPHAVELKDIKAIIDLMRKNDLSVFEMEKDGFRLKLQKGIGEQPMSMAPSADRASSAKRSGERGPSAAGFSAGRDVALARYRFADGGDILSRGFSGRACFRRCRQGGNRRNGGVYYRSDESDE